MTIVQIQPYDPDSLAPPSEVLSVIESGLVEITRRAEFYEADATTRWYPDPQNPAIQRLIEGSVNVDYNSDERRKLDITFDNVDQRLRPNPNGGFWYDKVIKVYRGVRYDPRDVEPRVAVVESEGADLNVAYTFVNALGSAGFHDNDIQLGVTDASSLKDYSWIVSGMKTSPTGVSSMLTTLWGRGKNILTFGTGNGAAQIPHYSTYTIPGGAITWGIGPVSNDTPTADAFRAVSGVIHRWTGTVNGSSSLELTPTGTVLRTNQAVAPRAGQAGHASSASSAGWGGTGPTGADNATGGPIENGPFRRYTANAAFSTPANSDLILMGNNLGIPGLTLGGTAGVIPGNVYTLSMYVRSSIAQKIHANAQMIKAGTGATGGGNGPDVTLVPNTWTRISVTSTAGADAQAMRADIDSATGALAWAIGNTFDVAAYQVEDGAVATAYFDGTTGLVTEAASPTATGTTPTVVVAGVQTLAVWTNTPNPQFITAAMMRNANGAVWIDIRLPDLTGPVTKKFMRLLLNYVRNYTSEKVWEAQLGEFYIDNISQANFPESLKVTARDATKKMINSKLTRTSSFVVGTNLEDFVIGEAALSGIPVSKMRFNMAGETLTTELSFDKGTSRWDMIKGALSSFNYEFFFNGEGFFVVRPFNDPTLSAIDFSFGTGPTGNLVSFEKAVNDSRIYNVIQVTAIPSDNADIPIAYFGEARNDDLSSPTNTTRLGERVLPIDAPWLSSDEDCAALAADYLKISALESYELNFSSIYYPWLEAGSIIEILDPDAYSFEPTRFLMDTIDFGLGLGPMSATGKRVTFVGEAN